MFEHYDFSTGTVSSQRKRRRTTPTSLVELSTSIQTLIYSFLDVRSLRAIGEVSRSTRESLLNAYKLNNLKSFYQFPNKALYHNGNLFLVQFGFIRRRRGMSFSTGVGHTICAKNSEVYVFGDGGYGELGLGATSQALSPERLPVEGFLKSPTEKIVQVTCGTFYTGLLSNYGNVYTFGCEENFKLGYEAQTPQLVPKQIPFKKKVEQISFGSNHGLLRISGGKVYAFGASSSALGLGPNVTRTHPTLIKSLSRENAIYISAGMQHSLVLTTEGQVYSFGFGRYGELGLNSYQHAYEPTLIDSFLQQKICIIRISAGASFSLAIDDQGVLYSFGRGFGGKLGHGKVEDRFLNEPIPRALSFFVENDIKVVDCKASVTHSIVLSAFGNVYTFGMNDYGKLGLGHEEPAYFPQRVSVKATDGEDVKFIAVNGGEWHTLLVSQDDELYTCGGGWFGRLGHGNQINLYLPTRVKGLPWKKSN